MQTGVPMRVYMRTRGMSKYRLYSSTAHEERGVFEKRNQPYGYHLDFFSKNSYDISLSGKFIEYYTCIDTSKNIILVSYIYTIYCNQISFYATIYPNYFTFVVS